MDLFAVLLNIIVVGFLVTVLTDRLPLNPMFKNLIVVVSVVWLLYQVMGWAGVNLHR